MVNSDLKDNRLNPFGIDVSLAARMRILVVDDDASLIGFLKQFLEELQFKVFTASTGEEALSQIDKYGEMDIALIDFRLPGMDGLETIERISEKSAETVMMVITGLPTLNSSIRALRLGASDYILKPFKMEEVASAIKRAMEERAIKLEIRNLRKRVAAMERKHSPTADIELNENIKKATSRNLNPGT